MRRNSDGTTHTIRFANDMGGIGLDDRPDASETLKAIKQALARTHDNPGTAVDVALSGVLADLQAAYSEADREQSEIEIQVTDGELNALHTAFKHANLELSGNRATLPAVEAEAPHPTA